MKIDKAQALEKFDDFLMDMDDQLEALQDEAASRDIELDLSMDDTERLERLFTLMSEGADKEKVASLIVFFARHLGEIVRTNFGGKWHLPLDNERNMYFNTPVIMGHAKIADLEFAPTFIMRAFALRRVAGTLRKAIDADIHISVLDLSDLAEE